MTNQVTMEFAADEKPVVQAFNKMGAAADALQGNMRGIDGASRQAGAGFDRMAEGSDTAETRFTGFYDTIGGTRDAIAAFNDESLSTSDRLVALGQAGADLAGGLTGFVVPALKSVWLAFSQSAAAQWLMTAAQTAWNTVTAIGTTIMNGLNAAMRANPILFIVGLVFVLISAFIALWQNSEGFRNFFIGMWNGIKNVVGNVVGFIKDVWNGIPGFFRGIGKAIGDAISGAFKGAVNGIISFLNGGISAINAIIRGINAVSGVVGIPAIPQIPKIPKLHTGGVVPGMLGEEQLYMLQAGERVIPRGQAGNTSGVTITVASDGDYELASFLRTLERKGILQLEGVG